MNQERIERILRELGPQVARHLEKGEAPCPSAETLRRFLGGNLPEEQAQHIAHHLLGCEACMAVVEAWEKVEEAESGEQKERETAIVSRRPAFGRWRPQRRRKLFLGAAAAAAAAVILFLFPAVFRSRILLSCELSSAAGVLRSAGFRREDAMKLHLRLAQPAFVYVFGFRKGEAESLFPAEGENPRVEGETVLPGKDSAWRLEDTEPDKYALLVGIRTEGPLPPEEKRRLEKMLASLDDPFDIRKILAETGPRFQALKLIRFTVLP